MSKQNNIDQARLIIQEHDRLSNQWLEISAELGRFKDCDFEVKIIVKAKHEGPQNAQHPFLIQDIIKSYKDELKRIEALIKINESNVKVTL